MSDVNLNLSEDNISISINEEENITVTVKPPASVAVAIKDGGPRGLPGPAGLTWREEWDNLTAYVAKDAVYYSGSSWVCLVDNTSQTPFEGSSYWGLIAKRGEGFVPRGPWDSGTTYYPDDVVEFDGSAYRCILQHTNISPPNATYWELFVSKGEPGAPGTGITWLGDWDSGTGYVLNDAVFNNGSAFVCNSPHTNQEPPNASYWDMLANGLRWRGAWSGATAYNETDLSRDDGVVYICIQAHTNQQPPNATYWEVFSEQGLQGPAGNGLLYGSGVPSDGTGNDGDTYIDEDSRIAYLNKGTPTPGSWTGVTTIPLAANPNGCRLTIVSSSQNPNSATPVPIEWNNTVRKDSGIEHSTGTNPSRIGPATGKGGRYELFAVINTTNAATIRTNLKLWIRKNGTTDLSAEGETYAGYNRASASSDKATAFIHWEGELLDTDYLEVMSEEGNVSGTIDIVDNSFINFKQTTLLENQAGGSGSEWGSWTDITTITAGWSDSNRNIQYRKHNTDGRVQLRGILTMTGGSAVVGATLPSGARPPSGLNVPIFAIATAGTGGIGISTAQIQTNGDIQFQWVSIGTWRHLAGIEFDTVYPA